MELMLEIISRHKFLSDIKNSHVFKEVGGYIGRSHESDWVLPDKSKKISRKHVLINSDGENFFLEDVSSNGVLSTLTRELVGKDGRYKINHGDSFQIGDYVFQARLLKEPEIYSSNASVQNSQVIPDEAFLNLDPLVALEQEELSKARERLGLYNELLGEDESLKATQIMPDHNPSALNAMLAVKPIPENWDPLEDIVQDGTGMIANNEFANKTLFPGQDLSQLPPLENLADLKTAEVETKTQCQPSLEADLFFKALGLQNIPDDQAERERILIESAKLLKASISGMIQSLQNRAASKNELRLPVTTMQLSGNNPFQFSINAEGAINQMFGKNTNGMMAPEEAMYSGFNDLHSHHMGIMAGTRAAISATLDRLSPLKIEERLDGVGHVKFRRHAKLWQIFEQLHKELMDHNGIADFFIYDFARAYDMQQLTLQPKANSKNRGDNK